MQRKVRGPSQRLASQNCLELGSRQQSLHVQITPKQHTSGAGLRMLRPVQNLN
jgi:hypothetical protein